MKHYGLMAVLGLMLSIGAVSAHDSHIHGQSSTNTALIDDNSFDAQMSRAMETMHRDMAVAPSGNPDRDFAAMMIPHHQGAIDMARIQLQFGKDPILRCLAEGIIVVQLQEVEVMKRALSELPADTKPPITTSPTSPTHKAH